MVDYFSGETLISNLFKPSIWMRNLNTKYGSGVSWKDMSTAVRNWTCFFGVTAARDKVFEFVGPEKFFISHASQNDLNVLRWIYPFIFDTQIINVRNGGKREEGLASLCSSHCGISIHNGDGDCSLEDAIATREVTQIFVKERMRTPDLGWSTLAPALKLAEGEEVVAEDGVGAAMEMVNEQFDGEGIQS